MDDAPDSPPPPSIRRRIWPRWGPRAVFECVLIVFSVVLALMLADWAEDRKTAERVREARTWLVAEIAANRAVLVHDQYLPHHRRLSAAFSQVPAGEPTREQAMPAFDALFDTGIHVAPLRDAVWRSVSTSDLAAEIPLTELFVLSDIYRQQDQLRRTSETFVTGMPTLLTGLQSGVGVKAAVMSVAFHLGDVTADETGLIQQYDAALARLDPDGRLRREAATPRPGDGGPATR